MNFLNRINPTNKTQDTALCVAIWPAMSERVFSANHYKALAAYAREEISRVQQDLNHFMPDQGDIEKIRVMMASIQTSSREPVEAVVRRFSGMASEDGKRSEQVLNIVHLGATLSTMMKIRTGSRELAEEPMSIWHAETSLEDATLAIFRNTSSQGERGRTIDPRLTMSYLSVFHKFRVVWTDRLDQHLNMHMAGKTRVIQIYQHKIWLSSFIDRGEQCIVPQGIICEALDTLNLLFPHNDRRTESFLKGNGQTFHSLGYCGRGRKLNLDGYPYWGDKIEALLEVIEGPRRGFWQFLPTPHRLSVVESANFWIATAAAMLAFVGFVLGLMSFAYAKWSYDIGKESLYASKESLEFTKLQYFLAIAQACSTTEEALLLPEFCKKA